MNQTLAFKSFWKSLRDDQKKDYRELSMYAQQKWYIRFLEDNFNWNKDKE